MRLKATIKNLHEIKLMQKNCCEEDNAAKMN